MKATKKNFQKLMNSLDNEQIAALIEQTWNDATGAMFREIGFEILETRIGEDATDELYNSIWNTHNAA